MKTGNLLRVLVIASLRFRLPKRKTLPKKRNYNASGRQLNNLGLIWVFTPKFAREGLSSPNSMAYISTTNTVNSFFGQDFLFGRTESTSYQSRTQTFIVEDI